MVPEMPALIPTSTFICKNIPKQNIQSQFPQSPEYLQLPPQPPYKISPSDEKLHKDLDYQIHLVKQIQQKLGTEQRKLRMMLKEFHTRNIKRKQTIESNFAKLAENENSQAKRLRICSPRSINGNLSVIKSDTKTVEKQTEKKNPVDESDSPSSCNGGGSSSSPRKQRKELETFRNFLSRRCDVFEDEEIDIKEELNPVVIEDLVLDEMDKEDNLAKLYYNI